MNSGLANHEYLFEVPNSYIMTYPKAKEASLSFYKLLIWILFPAAPTIFFPSEICVLV